MTKRRSRHTLGRTKTSIQLQIPPAEHMSSLARPPRLRRCRSKLQRQMQNRSVSGNPCSDRRKPTLSGQAALGSDHHKHTELPCSPLVPLGSQSEANTRRSAMGPRESSVHSPEAEISRLADTQTWSLSQRGGLRTSATLAFRLTKKLCISLALVAAALAAGTAYVRFSPAVAQDT